MRALLGLKCSRCERQLDEPFSSRVFTKDGDEYETKGMPSDAVDGHGSVVIYLHKACRAKGFFLNKNTGRNGKMTYARHRRGVRHVEKVGAADELRGMGFQVAAGAGRILMVLPDRVFEQ